MQEGPVVWKAGLLAPQNGDIGRSFETVEPLMYDDTAPLFFSEGVSCVTAAGPNSVLSFVVDIPSPDNQSKTRRVNLRVVIPHHSLVQNVEWLQQMLTQATQQHQQAMPPTVQ